MNRFIDFDEIFEPPPAPRAVEPVYIKLFQAVWELPGQISPAAIVRVWTLLGDGRGAELSKAELVGLLTDLVPADILAAWLELKISFAKLTDILVYLVDVYVDDED